MTERGGSNRVRADIDSVMSRSEKITPPCTLPQLVVKAGLVSSERRATPFSSESILTPRCSEKRIFLMNSAISGETPLMGRVSDEHGAAIHRDRFTGDVARGFRGKQHREPLQVFRAAEAPVRGALAHE